MPGAAWIVIGIGLLPAPSGDVAEAVRRIAARDGLQTSLEDPDGVPPEAPSEPRSEPARGGGRAAGRRPAEAPRRWEPGGAPDVRRREAPVEPASGGGGDVARAVLWLLLGALGVGLLTVLVSALRRGPARTAGAPAAAPARAAQSLPSGPLAAAAPLAEEGDFSAAVHRLLLEALRVLAASAGATIAPSETSREVLARLALTPPAHDALRLLVEAVEISRFGGRPIDRATWEQARAAWAAGRPDGGAA